MENHREMTMEHRFQLGERVDVLDPETGTWEPGTITRVFTKTSARVQGGEYVVRFEDGREDHVFVASLRKIDG